MRRFQHEDLAGAEFRECDLSGSRLVGVVMEDAEIDGLVSNLVVNGVEVTAYVEAELDRRHPVRVLLRSDEPGDLLQAWRQLHDDWAATIERARTLPRGSEHYGVDGEWSMVETLRHLVFVHDSWFRRCVLGVTEPFTAIGVRPQTVSELDAAARPTLGEVLRVRERQALEVNAWLVPRQATFGVSPSGEHPPVVGCLAFDGECTHLSNDQWRHSDHDTRDGPGGGRRDLGGDRADLADPVDESIRSAVTTREFLIGSASAGSSSGW
jgi:hypothetical protein